MTREPKVTDGSGERAGTPVPLTRVFITADGDMVITDLWDEVRPLVGLPPAEEF